MQFGSSHFSSCLLIWEKLGPHASMETQLVFDACRPARGRFNNVEMRTEFLQGHHALTGPHARANQKPIAEREEIDKVALFPRRVASTIARLAPPSIKRWSPPSMLSLPSFGLSKENGWRTARAARRLVRSLQKPTGGLLSKGPAPHTWR